MTKTIKLALVAAMAMGATSAFATNGDNLIGLGAKSRAMGGTGIAHFNGSESGTNNPALITKAKGTNFAFGGTYFRPDVEVKTTNAVIPANAFGPGSPVGVFAYGGEYTSDAKNNVIPYVAVTENLDNGFAVGMSMYGSAGMGVDFRDANPRFTSPNAAAGISPNLGGNGTNSMALYSMRSNLMLLKFSIPMAYGQDNWSVGVAPVMMYGSLDISFQQPNLNPVTFAYAGQIAVGNGSSSDLGVGYEAGAAYTLPDLGLTFGAKYQSAIEMEYKGQISNAAGAFGYGSWAGALPGFNDILEQPAEYGIGIDWTQGDITLTADVKRVEWASADGYKDFGWQDQNVFALGAEYRMDDLALRLGYNYAKNPIQNNMDTRSVAGAAGTNTNGDTMNAFNHVLFPGVTEKHYTIGAGYQFTKNVGADVAFVYATSPDVTVSGQTVNLGFITVSNNQTSVSANLNYSF